MSAIPSDREYQEKSVNVYDYRTWNTPKNLEEHLFLSTISLTTACFYLTIGSIKITAGCMTFILEALLLTDPNHQFLFIRGINDLFQAAGVMLNSLGHAAGVFDDRDLSVQHPKPVRN